MARASTSAAAPTVVKREREEEDPSASASASPAPQTGPTPAHFRIGKDGKPRKLAACDACKFRRVLCHPVPQPGSCPRCVEKGVKCTTTPVVRRRPQGRTGKRIEQSKVKFGAVEPEIKLEMSPTASPTRTPTPTPPPPAAAASSTTTTTKKQSSKRRRVESTTPAPPSSGDLAVPTSLPRATSARASSVASSTTSLISYPDPETPPLPSLPNSIPSLQSLSNLHAHAVEAYSTMPPLTLPLSHPLASSLSETSSHGSGAFQTHHHQHQHLQQPNHHQGYYPSSSTQSYPPSPTPSHSHSHSHSHSQPQIHLSHLSPNHLLGLAEASGSLAAHLLSLFQHTPDAFFPLPFLSRGRIGDEFEKVGRRLECLPKEIEVLANVIMCITAPLSGNELLVGKGMKKISYERLSTTPLEISKIPPQAATTSPTSPTSTTSTNFPQSSSTTILDPNDPFPTQSELKEFGQRKLSMCLQLRDNARKLMAERNTLAEANEENAASCHLMDVVESRLATSPNSYNRAYATAFAAHVRELADGDDDLGFGGGGGGSRLTGTPIIYSSFLMQANLTAAVNRKCGSFTENDQLVVCGPTPSIEATLQDNLLGVDVRESLRLFYLPLQPFIQGMTKLSRECTELITGAYARKNPLNEATLSAWLKTFESLQALLSVLMKRLEDQLAPEAVTAFAYPIALERERIFLLRACRFTLPIAWATLILPVFWELVRREELGGRGYGGNRERELSKVEGMLKRVRILAVKGAQTVAHCLRRDVPSYGYLTHLQYLKLEDFTQILLDADTDAEGGDGITQNQQLQDVGLLIAALRRTEFSWVHLSSQIDSFESRFQTLQLEQLLQGFTPGSSNDLFPPPFLVHGLPELSGGPYTVPGHALSGVRGDFEWDDSEDVGGETAWTKDYQSAW